MSVTADRAPARARMRAGFALLDASAIGPLRQAPGRTLLAVLAIALGVALGFSIYLINRVAADEVQGASRSLFGMADLAVLASGAGFDEQIFARIASLDGIVAASPAVEVQARLPGRDRSLKLVGIDPFRASKMQPALATAASSGAHRAGLLAENSVWLSPSAAQMPGYRRRRRSRRAGCVANCPAARCRPAARQCLSAARRLARHCDGTVEVAAPRPTRPNRPATCPGRGSACVRARIAQLLPPGATVTTPGEASDDAVRLTRAYRSNLTALALVALFTGAFLVYATQSLAVARRRREIALLHAIGMTVREQVSASLLSGALVGAPAPCSGSCSGSSSRGPASRRSVPTSAPAISEASHRISTCIRSKGWRSSCSACPRLSLPRWVRRAKQRRCLRLRP